MPDNLTNVKEWSHAIIKINCEIGRINMDVYYGSRNQGERMCISNNTDNYPDNPYETKYYSNGFPKLS